MWFFIILLYRHITAALLSGTVKIKATCVYFTNYIFDIFIFNISKINSNVLRLKQV